MAVWPASTDGPTRPTVARCSAEDSLARPRIPAPAASAAQASATQRSGDVAPATSLIARAESPSAHAAAAISGSARWARSTYGRHRQRAERHAGDRQREVAAPAAALRGGHDQQRHAGDDAERADDLAAADAVAEDDAPEPQQHDDAEREDRLHERQRRLAQRQDLQADGHDAQADRRDPQRPAQQAAQQPRGRRAPVVGAPRLDGLHDIGHLEGDRGRGGQRDAARGAHKS